MSMDDPGWAPFDEGEAADLPPSNAGAAPQNPPAAAGDQQAGGSGGWGAGPSATLPPPGAPAGPPPTGPGRPGGRRTPLIAGAAVVAVAVVVVAAVALTKGGGPGTTTTTAVVAAPTTAGTAPATTASVPSSAATTAPTGTTPGSGASTLASEVPFQQCQDLPAAQRGIPGATDEVACTGSDVDGEGAAVAFYAEMPSSAAAAAYIAALDPGAPGGPGGSCSTVQIGPGTALCDFEDQDDSSGVAALFLGTSFSFSTSSTSQGDCALLNMPTTNGTADAVWSYSGSTVVGGLISCSESATALASMRTALLNGDLSTNG